MDKSLTVNINVPISIKQISDNEYDVFLSETRIGTVHPDGESFEGVVANFPKRLRLSTSHDNLHTQGVTLEECAGNVIIKIMNIMLNRYRFECKTKKKV